MSRPVRWIVNAFDGFPDWAQGGEIPVADVPFRTADTGEHIAALREGIGMATLPCLAGDADPLLARAPGTPLHLYGTLWLLTQGETRRTRRVQLFTDFLARRLAAHAPLLAGRSLDLDRSVAG